MENLKTLVTLTIGALVLSAVIAIAAKDNGGDLSIDISINDSSDDEDKRSTQFIIDGDRGKFTLWEDDHAIEAVWKGDFELDPLATTVTELDNKLEIVDKSGDDERRVVFKKSRGDIHHAFYLDDEEQDEGPETDAAISDLLMVFLRASGMKSEERVDAILDQGGVDAVLDEMAFLSRKHATRSYVWALTEKADLSDAQILRLVDIVKEMEGDHDIRKSISAILENETITANLVPPLIEATEGVESDYDLRKLMESFAERRLNEEAMERVIMVFERMDSDHDLRKSAEALIENDALDDQATARLLIALSERMDSDHDLRLILTDTAKIYSADPEATKAWLIAFEAVDSDHDRRLSIEEVAASGAHPDEAWVELIKAAAIIDSDHDLRRALESIAAEMERNEILLAAYRDTAAGIDSDSDRERALEAIGEGDDE